MILSPLSLAAHAQAQLAPPPHLGSADAWLVAAAATNAVRTAVLKDARINNPDFIAISRVELDARRLRPMSGGLRRVKQCWHTFDARPRISLVNLAARRRAASPLSCAQGPLPRRPISRGAEAGEAEQHQRPG